MQYSVVDRTGRIVRFGECQQELLGDQAGPGEHAIVGAYHDLAHHVPGIDPAGPVVTDLDAEPRPELPAILSRATVAADGVETAVISGLPVPCAFTVDGEPHETTDGSIEITATVIGTYVVEVDRWPFLRWRAEIKAT